MIAQDEMLKTILTSSVSIVALSMPALGFLLSQIVTGRGFPSEQRPYKILAVFFIMFQALGISVILLSYAILSGLAGIELSIYAEYSFLAMLLSIPVTIIVVTIVVLKK